MLEFHTLQNNEALEAVRSEIPLYHWDDTAGKWLIYTLLLAIPFPAKVVRSDPARPVWMRYYNTTTEMCIRDSRTQSQSPVSYPTEPELGIQSQSLVSLLTKLRRRIQSQSSVSRLTRARHERPLHWQPTQPTPTP